MRISRLTRCPGGTASTIPVGSTGGIIIEEISGRIFGETSGISPKQLLKEFLKKLLKKITVELLEVGIPGVIFEQISIDSSRRIPRVSFETIIREIYRKKILEILPKEYPKEILKKIA